MSLEDLIYKNRKRQLATATPATSATPSDVSRLSVARVATVAVATTRVSFPDAANCSKSSNCSRSKPETAKIPHDCIGALQASDGGLYLPWGPCLSLDDVHRMRADLVGMIEALADLETWDAGRRDDVLTRAIRGPLADLPPNLAHFQERLTEARAERAARELADRRSWRCTDEALRNRGVM
jgi:hypothetical protein